MSSARLSVYFPSLCSLSGYHTTPWAHLGHCLQMKFPQNPCWKVFLAKYTIWHVSECVPRFCALACTGSGRDTILWLRRVYVHWHETGEMMRRKMEMAEILYAAFPSFLVGKAYSQTYQVPEALHRILGSEKILPVREENLMEHLFHLVTLVSIRWVGCIQGYLIGWSHCEVALCHLSKVMMVEGWPS